MMRSSRCHRTARDNQVDIAAQRVELASFGLGADLRMGRDVDERRAGWADLVGQVGMVGSTIATDMVR